MQRQEIIANPFALMMDPQSVVNEMERSERLNRLQRRVCRPLDKPLIPHVGDETASFDAAIEQEPEVADSNDFAIEFTAPEQTATALI